MRNPETPTRTCTLAELPTGVPARILGVHGADADRLAALGFRPGPQLIVEGDAPFRGPRIVRMGAARIALARSAAGSIRVEPRPASPTATTTAIETATLR